MPRSGREKKGREFFLSWLFHNLLQLQVVLMAKRVISGRPVLTPPNPAVPAELRQWETWPEEGPHADHKELVPRRRWVGNARVVASTLRGPCGPGSRASRAPALNPARDPGRGHEGCHVGIWWWGHSSAQDRLLQGNQYM